MKKIPQHIVLFPDGNRRWAKKQGLPSLKGHQEGYKNLLNFGDWCRNKGVRVFTAFGFSTENWKRSKPEVDYLMNLLEMGLLDSLKQFQKDGVRVKIIGDRTNLKKSLLKAIDVIEDATKDNKKLHLNLAISYGGKWDIINAAKQIVKENIAPEKINEKIFESHLSTAGLPDPDLIIRAGGEQRLSNFVLWQAAYAELYFSDKLWPDFSEKDLDEALEEFDRRNRRFGGN